ncbi:hypothetical protein [Peribacillus glennii]|uniref:Ferrochelatase n=1 Tax=Peribacillus glennii TaxID=2303991 RepID=A0A372L963_9BACI|nr:hypothetical protein [Peribacillus glennii]RFU62068.1 hypothetical protein D0466_15920 [Peribacillus glennii]
MKGIVLLNPHFSIGQLPRTESLLFQKMMVDKLTDEWKVTILQLNPYQIHDYYTIPHALLLDIQTQKPGILDCLFLYSLHTVERFQYIYPEKWEELEGHFSKVVTVEQMETGSSAMIL